MRNVWHEVRAFVGGFLRFLMICVVMPLMFVLNVLAVVYMMAPLGLGMLTVLLLHPALPVALDVVAGVVVTLFGWYVEDYINERTGFPFTMLII